MREYDRSEYEDYDDYEDEGQEQGYEYEEEGEEEYEEEQPPKPTKEELEYLELRQKLKESIRKQMKKESSTSSSSSERKNRLPYDNYGSFFGPSQPVIAQRVIQESKSLLENQHLASRLSNPHHINKDKNKVPNGGSKSSVQNQLPKVSEVKIKAQKIKNTRDYSFLLSDDAELPAPAKEPPPRNMPARSSDARPAQVQGKNKQPLSNGGKHIYSSREDRKVASVGGKLHPIPGSNNKLTSTSKPSMASADSRKQLANNSGNGPGRSVGSKGLPSKTPVGTMGNKSPAFGTKNPVKPPLSKVHSSISKQSVEQRKNVRESNKPKMILKQPVASSIAQTKKPPAQNPMHRALPDQRPKKKPVRRPFDDDDDDEGEKAINMIRRMFHYNPNKFADDDDDDIDMEAGFDDIMREERRSAQIAQREDEEQLRLIEEEEARERKRRMAKLKKRKLAEH